MKSTGPAVLVALALSSTCCGSDSPGDTSTSSSSSTSTTTTSVSTTAPSNECLELLVFGCTGASVERLQRLLQRGIDKAIAVDGRFGPLTEGALDTFERLACPITVCTVDGEIIVDGEEWKELAGLDELDDDEPELSA